MNRPLKRKLELALMAFVDSVKSGTAYAAVPTFSSHGTTLAGEVASTPPAVTEPTMPFIAVEATTTPDEELPGVVGFTLVIHLKTDATDSGKSRMTADAIVRDLHNAIMESIDPDSAFSDSNRECEAFLVFANRPAAPAEDLRPVYRKPIHVYDMSHDSAETVFDGENWHDQLSYSGTAQDMDWF
jgi:hypothetical protein